MKIVCKANDCKSNINEKCNQSDILIVKGMFADQDYIASYFARCFRYRRKSGI